MSFISVILLTKKLVFLSTKVPSGTFNNSGKSLLLLDRKRERERGREREREKEREREMFITLCECVREGERGEWRGREGFILDMNTTTFCFLKLFTSFISFNKICLL